MARCISCVFATGSPSSLKATTPTSASAPISVNSSPLLPFVIQPTGRSVTGLSTFAFCFTQSTATGLSKGGSVFGIQQTVAKPPIAAAFVPVAIVSLSSKPGSLRWQWRSINPGQTISPEASRFRALLRMVESVALGVIVSAICMILPSAISRSPTWFIPWPGSII